MVLGPLLRRQGVNQPASVRKKEFFFPCFGDFLGVFKIRKLLHGSVATGLYPWMHVCCFDQQKFAGNVGNV